MKYTFSLFVGLLLILSAPAYAQVWDINTVAGTGFQFFGGDGNVATAAYLSGPLDIAFDTAGNYYIIDFYNFRVRKVNASDNHITTIAGNGVSGYTGDGNIATNAEMFPRGVAVDRALNVYISDAANSVIRKVTPAGIITRFAGIATVAGYSGNGGAALNAQFSNPFGMCFDSGCRNLYIADAGNHVIRKINMTTNIISTVAGNDTAGYTGDTRLAIHAELDSPYAVTFDRNKNLYIADNRNDVIRKVDTAGVITTVAGDGISGYSGDGNLAISAKLNSPKGITVDSVFNIYICDADNNVIRRVDPTGIIRTMAGDHTEGYSGDLGPALAANLFNPYAIAQDKQGSLYFCDANNERVRKLYNSTLGVGTVVKATVSVHPNPFTDNITVSGLTVSDRVGVYDITGRQVSDTWTVTNSGTQTFSISGLAPGIYTLRVTNADGAKVATQKLVKE